MCLRSHVIPLSPNLFISPCALETTALYEGSVFPIITDPNMYSLIPPCMGPFIPLEPPYLSASPAPSSIISSCPLLSAPIGPSPTLYSVPPLLCSLLAVQMVLCWCFIIGLRSVWLTLTHAYYSVVHHHFPFYVCLSTMSPKLQHHQRFRINRMSVSPYLGDEEVAL